MATKFWVGGAPAVAQVSSIQVTAYDASTLYEVLVDGEVIASAEAEGSANDTAAALEASWNASESPYAIRITATSNTDTLTLTSDVAGLPFTVTTQVTGGTGTLGTVTTVTANSGPNVWDVAANWSDDTVPVDTDTVIFKDSAIPVCWGINQSGIDLTELQIYQSYTGRIGTSKFLATSADGLSVDSTRLEYRNSGSDNYLSLTTTKLRIGEHYGSGTPAGSSRLKINVNAVACDIEIFNTSSNTADTGLPAVQLKANNSSTDVYIRSAPGGVGFAIATPTETTTIGDVSISDTTTTSKIFAGPGTTLGTYTQNGGVSVLALTALTTLTVNGGTCTVEGDLTITTVNVKDGVLYDNHIKTSGTASTTVNITGGTLNALESNKPRTWATVNLTYGTLRADGGVLTITTLNEPSAGKYQLVAS